MAEYMLAESLSKKGNYEIWGLPPTRLENSQNYYFKKKEIAKSGAPPSQARNCQNNYFSNKEITKSGTPPSQARNC